MKTSVSLNLDLPATTQYLNVLSACIGALLEHAGGLQNAAAQIYNCQVAAQELAANIVSHAICDSQGQIHFVLTLESDPFRFVLESTDEGAEFAPTSQTIARWGKSSDGDWWTLQEADEVDWSAEHGRGVWLMSSLVDAVSYRRDQGLNYWRMEKGLA